MYGWKKNTDNWIKLNIYILFSPNQRFIRFITVEVSLSVAMSLIDVGKLLVISWWWQDIHNKLVIATMRRSPRMVKLPVIGLWFKSDKKYFIYCVSDWSVSRVFRSRGMLPATSAWRMLFCFCSSQSMHRHNENCVCDWNFNVQRNACAIALFNSVDNTVTEWDMLYNTSIKIQKVEKKGKRTEKWKKGKYKRKNKLKLC